MKTKAWRGPIQIGSKNTPRVELDLEAHAAHVRFGDGRVARTDLVPTEGCLVTVDRDANGDVLGVEFVGIDRFNLPELMKWAGIALSETQIREAYYVLGNIKEPLSQNW